MPTTGSFKLHRTWCTKLVLKREITGRMPSACFLTTLTCWGIGEGWCHCVIISFFFHQPLHLNYDFISPPPSSLFRSSPSPPPSHPHPHPPPTPPHPTPPIYRSQVCGSLHYPQPRAFICCRGLQGCLWLRVGYLRLSRVL